MIPKFFSWAACWMIVPFSTCSQAQFQFIFQLSILNGICHLNYPNSLGSSPAVPHYKPKSCNVLGTPLLSQPPRRRRVASDTAQLLCLQLPYYLFSFWMSCFQHCLPNPLYKQTDTKNDAVRRGRPLVSVSSPHELVLASPRAPEGALSFKRDLGTSFHTSVALAAHLVRRKPGLS